MADNIGKLILRLMLGGMMLFHGIDKALHGVSFIKGMLKVHNLPEVLVYGVYIGEILAPIFLIIGWQSRAWAGVIGINMLMAIYMTQMGSLLKLGTHGSWAVETPMFFLLTAVVIMFLGSGKYAVTRD